MDYIHIKSMRLKASVYGIINVVMMLKLRIICIKNDSKLTSVTLKLIPEIILIFLF